MTYCNDSGIAKRNQVSKCRKIMPLESGISRKDNNQGLIGMTQESLTESSLPPTQ
jgi:hypothetical protein